MRAQSDKLELIDLHVSREASTTLRVWVEEQRPAPSSDAARKARIALLVCAQMGYLKSIKPHEWGTPLEGPLGCYGPVTRGNAEVALNLELRYFLDAIKRKDVAASVVYLKGSVALWKRLERAA
jgi:hypothetical protein